MEALWQTIDTLLGVSATKAEELTIGQVCLRAVVVYIVLIAYVRFATPTRRKGSADHD